MVTDKGLIRVRPSRLGMRTTGGELGKEKKLTGIWYYLLLDNFMNVVVGIDKKSVHVSKEVYKRAKEDLILKRKRRNLKSSKVLLIYDTLL